MVYQPDHGYVPVCLDGFNRGAAAAVCRQLEFEDAEEQYDRYYAAPGSYVDSEGNR